MWSPTNSGTRLFGVIFAALTLAYVLLEVSMPTPQHPQNSHDQHHHWNPADVYWRERHARIAAAQRAAAHGVNPPTGASLADESDAPATQDVSDVSAPCVVDALAAREHSRVKRERFLAWRDGPTQKRLDFLRYLYERGQLGDVNGLAS